MASIWDVFLSIYSYICFVTFTSSVLGQSPKNLLNKPELLSENITWPTSVVIKSVCEGGVWDESHTEQESDMAFM